MKNILTFAFVLFLTNLFAQHTNGGFAVVAGLGEGKAFSTRAEAYDRFIQAFENPTLAPFFEERGEQCYRNARKTLGGVYRVPAAEWIDILGWCKRYPDSAYIYGVAVYQLPAGSYTFETLSNSRRGVVKGNEIIRQAHAGEWVLEVWSQKMASSWCLNLFASVGAIQPPRPTTSYVEPPNPATFQRPRPACGCESIPEWEPGPETGRCKWTLRRKGIEPRCDCDYIGTWILYYKWDGSFLYIWKHTYRDGTVVDGYMNAMPWWAENTAEATPYFVGRKANY